MSGFSPTLTCIQLGDLCPLRLPYLMACVICKSQKRPLQRFLYLRTLDRKVIYSVHRLRGLLSYSFHLTVDTLLNPCTCKSVWKCECRAKASSGADRLPMQSDSEANRLQNNGLATLAQAAAMCSLDDAPCIDSVDTPGSCCDPGPSSSISSEHEGPSQIGRAHV